MAAITKPPSGVSCMAGTPPKGVWYLIDVIIQAVGYILMMWEACKPYDII